MDPQRENVEGEDGAPSHDNNLQAMMVNIDLAKQSLLVENPFFLINPESQSRVVNVKPAEMGVGIRNTADQSLYGTSFAYIQQQKSHNSTNVQNASQIGNPNSSLASFPFILDPTSLLIDQKNHNYHPATGNNSMYPHFQHISYNMQPHQMFSNGMFFHSQVNPNIPGGIGAKRKLDQLNLNHSNIKTAEEDQSYNAVSASSSSNKSNALTRKDYMQLQHQHLPHEHTIPPPTSSSNANSQQIQDKDPLKRRRNERNRREQERSKRINQQIKELRSVLNESNVSYKQNKYSILVTVVEYIKQLQKRSSLAENEKKRLTNTVKQFARFSTSGLADTSNQSSDGYLFRSESDIEVGNDKEQVKGIDYKAVFEQCQFPFAILSIDGKFLMCNAQFEAMTGLEKSKIEYTTLFDLVTQNECEKLFSAISNLIHEATSEDPTTIQSKLKVATRYQTLSVNIEGNETGEQLAALNSVKNHESRDKVLRKDEGKDCHKVNLVKAKPESFGTISFWSSKLSRPSQNLAITLTLTRTLSGKPKFLNCTISEINTISS